MCFFLRIFNNGCIFEQIENFEQLSFEPVKCFKFVLVPVSYLVEVYFT